MASYTTGQIKRLYYVDESVYATTPASALGYSGEIAGFKMDCNFNPELVYLAGMRSFQASYRGPYDVGFTYKAICRIYDAGKGAWNWTDFWAKYGMGLTTGMSLTDSLPTFSALTGKTVGANNYYNLWNGCKANKLSISCDKPGTAIQWEMDCLAQMVEWDTDKTFIGLQSVTVGADPTPPTSAILAWKGNLRIDLGAGLTTIYPSKFALEVNHNLRRDYGIVTGNDTINYPVATWLQEDKAEVTLDMTLPHGTETFNAAKKDGTAVLSATIPLGNKTLTLYGGVFDASDFPDYTQAAMEESVKIHFGGTSPNAAIVLA